MRLFLFFVATVLISACVPMTPPVSRMPFPENEYKILPKVGTATVRGQVFMKTRGGDVKKGAGERVELNPVTSYSMEWYEKAYLTGRVMSKVDNRIEGYIRAQVNDGEGRFTFKNVPPGEYFVTSRVIWESATGYQGSLEMQGGRISKRITVKDGEELDVIVTR